MSRLLPAEPLRELLRRRAKAVDGGLAELAVTLGVDRHALKRVFQYDRVRLDTADRLACALGRHPGELWPQWYATG